MPTNEKSFRPNFWQIIGGLLLVAGLVLLIRRETGAPPTPIEPVAPPSQVMPSSAAPQSNVGTPVPTH